MSHPDVTSLLLEIQQLGFTDVSEIAAGSFCRVYRGKKGSRAFAIKLPKDPSRSAVVERELLREMALLGRISAPGLPKAFEFGKLGGGIPYSVIELAQGRTLSAWLAEGRLPEHRALWLAHRLLNALEAIHTSGFVHRDIKPDNIICDFEASELKLIDLGLAEVGEADDQTKASIAGTFTYAAPEQTGALKRAVDLRSDLYSLGVVLYETLAGKVPFQAANVGELIRKHLNEEAAPLEKQAPGISPAFAAVVHQLLAKDPDDRFQSAVAVREALCNSGMGNANAGPPPELPNSFVGREVELRLLADAWRSAESGEGRFVLIEGEPGAGKSRLVRESLQAAYKKGIVLSGKCVRGVPLAPFRQSIQDFAIQLRRRPPEEQANTRRRFREAAGEWTSVLEGFQGALAELISEKKGAPASNAKIDDQERFFDAMATFLCRLGRPESPLLLYLDDIQWLDESSIKLVRSLAERLSGGAALVLQTSRNDPESRAALESYCELLKPAGLVRREVRAFDTAEHDLWLSRQLPHREVDPALGVWIHGKTAGNPFSSGVYLRTLLDRGVVRPHWEKWIFDRTRLAEVALPENVVGLILARTRDLPQWVRSVLEDAALIGVRFSIEELRLLKENSTIALDRVLEAALEAQLLERNENGTYKFVHDRVHEAFLGNVPEARARAIHLELAAGYLTLDQENPEFVYARARHCLKGDPASQDPSVIYDACLRAGQVALAQHSTQEALAFLLEAEKFSGGDRARQVLLFDRLGDLYLRTGQSEIAQTYLKRAIEVNPDPYDRAQLYQRLSRAQLASLEVAHGIEAVNAGFKALGRAAPGVRPLQVIGMLCHWALGVFVRRTGLGFGSAKGKRRKEIQVLVSLYEQAGLSQFFNLKGYMLLVPAFRTFFWVHLLGPSRELVYNYCNYAMGFAILQIPKLAENVCARMISIAEALGDPELVAHARTYQAFCSVFYGDEALAQKRCIALITQSQYWLDTEDYTNLCGCLMSSLVLRGYAEECQQWAREMARFLATRTGLASGTQSHCQSWMNSYMLSSLSMLGQVAETRTYKAAVQEYFETHADDRYHRGIHLNNRLQFLLETEDFSDEVAASDLQAHSKLNVFIPLAPLHIRHFYAIQAQYLFERYRRATGARRVKARKEFLGALFQLRIGLDVALLRAHYWTVRGAFEVEEGKIARGLATLQKAEKWAKKSDNPLCYFEILRVRARAAAKLGDLSDRQRQAYFAAELARKHGWAKRLRSVEKEFELASHPSTVSESVRSVSVSVRSSSMSLSTSHGPGSMQQIRLGRTLDALMRVNLAVASSTDAEGQTAAILDELLATLGGERAFLFLKSESDGALQLSMGRNASKQKIPELTGFSSTVVRRVYSLNEPVLVSGSESGEVLGSASIVAQDLRSIIAAPIQLGDRVLGVVYLDSTFAKGIFSDDDVSALKAIASPIGVLVETARAAQLEKERMLLAKDLEHKKAVQDILDNLDEGFLMFDSSGQVQPAVSRAVNAHFGEDLRGKGVARALATKSVNSDDVQAWIQMLFEETIPFEDLAVAGPRVRHPGDGRTIALDYRPVRGAEGKVERAILISSDTTEKVRLQNQALRESEAAKMYLLFAQNPKQFAAYLSELQALVNQIGQLLVTNPGAASLEKAKLYAHTAYGSASASHLIDVATEIRRFEELLRDPQASASADSLKNGVAVVKEKLDSCVEELRRNLGGLSWEKGVREIPEAELEQSIRRWSRDGGISPSAAAALVEFALMDEVGGLLKPYQESVGTIAKKLNKKVDFVLQGDVQVRVWEKPLRPLFQSLIHTVRNALDHGIETPEERVAAGKPEAATLTMEVRRVRQGVLRLEIRDDGRGVDPEAIRKRLVQKGLASEADLKSQTDEQVIQRIFDANFSSRDEVSELSGRGVGLSAVLEEARRLGGTAHVQSKKGQGASIVLEVTVEGAEVFLQPPIRTGEARAAA